MNRLTGRMWDIAAGRTDLPLEKVMAYRARWAARGFLVPPMHGKPRAECWDGLGDAVAWLIKTLPVWREECAKCWSRRLWLNAAVPFPIRWPVVPLP
jgi:hypothetical protein